MRTAPALLLLASLGPSAALAADCEAPVTAKAFAQIVSAGDTAYANLDETGFRTARSQATAALPCLSEGLTSGQAAAYHRLEALGAFLDRDHAGAVASFKALRAAAPGYELPEAMAPPNHPLRTYFDIAVGAPEVPGRPLRKPSTGWVHLDGAGADELPTDRPAIYQRFTETGALTETLMVRPGLPVAALTRESTDRARPERRINVGLASAAGVAALASGGLYLAANSRSNSFWDPTTPTSELASLRQQTNTFGWMSAGFGAVALGTGTAAMLVGTW